jgi:hypothetical protein
VRELPGDEGMGIGSKIGTELWEGFKKITPRSIPLNEAIEALIDREVARAERAVLKFVQFRGLAYPSTRNPL